MLCFSTVVFGESADLVLVEKGARKLTLMNGKKVIATYTIALGGSPEGPKRCQGDGKTPEGHYTIVGRNLKSSFYRSLRVSYPNEHDKAEAKAHKCSPGGDIMIHGLPNGRGWFGESHSLVDWTNGCIAVTNSEMDQIWKMVADGTRVQIEP